MPCHVARGGGVVAQIEHHQRIAQPGIAQADTAFGSRLGLLLRQRPDSGVQHVVEHAHRHPGDLGKGFAVKTGAVRERIPDKARQVDRAQAAAAVRGQRLLGAISAVP